MRVLILPGTYKSTLRSVDAVRIIESRISRGFPDADIHTRVLADGGEGTLEMFEAHFDAAKRHVRVSDPMGRSITGSACLFGSDSVLIESCQAVGISLLSPSELNPLIATSAGIADFLRWAISTGRRTVFIGMGDSAIMDLGVGMLGALGVKFYNSDGYEFQPTLNTLSSVADFDDSAMDEMRSHISVSCLVDTDDLLSGPNGQVQLYGAQKGLAESQIPSIEAAYSTFCSLVRRKKGVDLLQLPRATGSGGLAAACHAFLNAPLLNTLEYLDQHLRLKELLSSADLVFTGEGCLDNQSKYGKVPYFVAKYARRKVICLVGQSTLEGVADIKKVHPDCQIYRMDPTLSMTRTAYALESLCDHFIDLHRNITSTVNLQSQRELG